MTAIETVRRYVTEDVEARLFRPTGEAVGLPGSLYTDPAFFGVERELTFGRSWVCAGIVDDLPNPGDLVPIDIAGIPILLARAADGTIRAFHNICRHRGVKLVSEPTRRNLVVCPYHAWSYTLDGKLLKTPNYCGPDAHTHDGFDAADRGLLPIRCELWHRLIFINLDAAAPSLMEDLTPLLRRWSAYDFSRLRHGGSLRFELKANWKLVIENFVERYHLPFVHPLLNSVSSVKHTLHIVDSDRFVGVGSRNFDPPPVTPDHQLPTFPGLTAEQLKKAEYVELFPNVMLGCHYNHFYAFILQPVGVDRTIERFEFFFIGDEAMTPELAPARKQMVDLVDLVNGEDIDIVQRLHEGCASPAMAGCVFSPVMEDTTHQFQKMVVGHMLAAARAA
ncbi:MAG TPA: aromatic ring-hydroxylating dioxygenase subunit alpha [Stellaceae bacterium]|nr:aromatic ring-hydroxylating dioxygenase subunit alpha [Stellaceae bacterium]